MLDDADYNDFGFYSTDAVTPNIDAIARQGVVLSRYYSAGAACSPTRASFITGNLPARYGLGRLWTDLPASVTGDYFQGKRGLPESDATLARSLGMEGYRSLHIGKWHIGTSATRFLPKAQGFEFYELMAGAPWEGTMRVSTESGAKTVTSEWRARYQADRIISFIDDNLASGQNLFINWWPIEPHAVPQGDELFYVPATFDRAAFNAAAPNNRLNLGTNRGKLVATMFAFDSELGRIVDFIKQKGVFDDSLVIVTSDNGGYQGALSPTRDVSGHKEMLAEGGIRVPFATSWPNRFAAGTHSDLLVTSTDLFPTIMALIGGALPANIEGENLSTVLLNGRGSRKPMFFEARLVSWRKSAADKFDQSFALIDGCDKIIQVNLQLRYYDVCTDPGERNELSGRNSARFSALRTMLRERRPRASEYLSISQLGAVRNLPSDDRLDIHHDDLSVYATMNLDSVPVNGTYTIYRRGDGVDFRIADGMLTATVTGVADSTVRPAFRTVKLSAPMPRDGNNHRVGLVIRGYLFGGSTLRLFVDGRLVAEAAAPLNARLQAGQSIFAVKSESMVARLGDASLSMSDVQIYLNALEPDEF
jgi:arylsulfatase A